MKKHPLSPVILSWLYIAAGAVGFTYHFTELNFSDPFINDALLLLAIRLCAVIGGIAVLKNKKWGRHLLIVWAGFHVITGALHSVAQFSFHAVLFTITMLIFYYPALSEYFFGKKNS